jgi:hypothetical protein
MLMSKPSAASPPVSMVDGNSVDNRLVEPQFF